MRCRNRGGIAASNKCYKKPIRFAVSMAHNVLAVYDVFAVAIREREAFQQPQKCGWRLAWEWSVAE
jgi:hypothetical protein